jgi:hypothetical protein
LKTEAEMTTYEGAEASAIRAEHYMEMGIVQIDRVFGANFAKLNPLLLGEFMRTAASDFHSHALAAHVERLSDSMRAVERAITATYAMGLIP